MTDYKKNLGIKESTAIVISSIIGSGIFPSQFLIVKAVKLLKSKIFARVIAIIFLSIFIIFFKIYFKNTEK